MKRRVLMESKKNRLFVIVPIFLALGTVKCASDKETSIGKRDAAPQARKVEAKSESKEKKESRGGPKVFVSGNKRSFTYSSTNNSLSSHAIDRKAVKELADKLGAGLRNPDFKDRDGLDGLVVVRNVGALPLDDVLDAARRLVNVEMEKDIQRDMSENAKLNIALSAIREKKISIAEYYLYELQSSKDRNIKAAAYTAEGMIALADNRLPEAIDAWMDALQKGVPNYKPAILNIGFLALKYGDYITATRMLSKIAQEDWFALYGLVIAARLEGKEQKAASLCTTLLSKRPNYRPGILSCALNEYQGLKRYEKARAMLSKMLKDGKGPPEVDEKGYRVLEDIDRAERESKKAQNTSDKKDKADAKKTNEKNDQTKK